MRNLFFFICLLLLLLITACNNSSKSKTEKIQKHRDNIVNVYPSYQVGHGFPRV